MKKCVCGYVASKKISAHVSACKLYKAEVVRVTANAAKYLEEMYLSCYSVLQCVEQIIEKENTEVQHGAIRRFADSFLDNLGIREGCGGKNNNRMKQGKIRKTTMQRYGVNNVGQILGNSWANNSIPYEQLSFIDELSEFRKQVGAATWNAFMRMKRRGTVPTECHYTHIKFNDDVLERVNPNDPFKRTIDHLVPVTEAFFKGWTVEQTSGEENIVFCLRVINTLKSNTNYDDFVNNYLPYIKEKLHESKISKEVGKQSTSM